MWQCKKCREPNEESFDLCWSCGTDKDGHQDPSFRVYADAEAGERGMNSPAAASSAAQTARLRPRSSACPKCGSHQRIPAVRVVDRDGNIPEKNSLVVRLDRHPEAWFYKDPESVELEAEICGQCGYTELYATNPTALWRVHQDRLESS